MTAIVFVLAALGTAIAYPSTSYTQTETYIGYPTPVEGHYVYILMEIDYTLDKQLIFDKMYATDVGKTFTLTGDKLAIAIQFLTNGLNGYTHFTYGDLGAPVNSAGNHDEGGISPKESLMFYGNSEIGLLGGDFEGYNVTGVSFTINKFDVIQYNDGILHDYVDFSGTLNVTIKNSAPVPEPTSILLLGLGFMGLVGFRRKFQK